MVLNSGFQHRLGKQSHSLILPQNVQRRILGHEIALLAGLQIHHAIEPGQGLISYLAAQTLLGGEERDLIGRDPERYDGCAYGNISVRAQRGFVISGTQTGGEPALTRDQLAWVVDFNVAENRLRAGGPVSVNSRLGFGLITVRGATYGPTQMHREQLDIGVAQLAELEARSEPTHKQALFFRNWRG